MTLRRDPLALRRREVLPLIASVAALAIGVVRADALDASAPTKRLTASEIGLRGDGKTDVTAELAKALNSGAVIDGQGGVFAIRGNLEAGPAFRGLVNARLVQLDPGEGHRRTLFITGAAGFILENLVVLRGGTGGETVDRALVGDNGGVFISGCRDFSIRGLEVGGGGIGTAIAIIRCTDFVADDLSAKSLWYRLDTHPKDDAIQGIFLVLCSRFTLRKPRAADFGGSDKQWAASDKSRGLAVTGCSDFTIEDVDVRRVGQGVDLTGSGSNSRFRIVRGVVEDCYSWGFKFANGSVSGMVTDAIARRCGIGGFVITGPSEASNARPRDVAFTRCVSEDVTGVFPKSEASFGFGIMSTSVDPSYPRAVVFNECVAKASSAHCCMRIGFRNDVSRAVAADEPNEVIRCRVEGPIATTYAGF